MGVCGKESQQTHNQLYIENTFREPQIILWPFSASIIIFFLTEASVIKKTIFIFEINFFYFSVLL